MLNAKLLNQQPDQDRKYKTEHKEKPPQDLGRIRRQQQANIFYKCIGNEINKPDQGGLKRHGIHVSGVQGKFAGGFGLIIFRDDSGEKIPGQNFCPVGRQPFADAPVYKRHPNEKRKKVTNGGKG